MANKILIVEPNEYLRTEYTKAFEAVGLVPEFTEDGAHAIQIINENPIHMVVSEWDMPSIHGSQLCKYVKKYSNRKIFFLFLTYDDSEKNINEALEIGADDFIKKPIHPKLLARKVKTLLELGGFLGGFRLRDVLESLPSLTTIINKSGIIVDFYKSKEFKDDGLILCEKGKEVIEYLCEDAVRQLGEKEGLLEIVENRRVKTLKATHDGSRYELRVGPLNGEYSIITVTDITERGKELIDTIDGFLLEIDKIKMEK